MSLLSAVRTYLAGYSGLKSGAPLWVNHLGSQPTEYAIAPMPGAKVIESYINGASLRVFPFSFQSMESTADDLERLESAGFFEAFSEWLEAQTAAGNLPTLDTGKTPVSIEATSWGYIHEQGRSETGIYLVQCKLTYQQEPIVSEEEEP
jgi:hypothetical protein